MRAEHAAQRNRHHLVGRHPLEWVEAETGDVQVFNHLGRIQGRKLEPKALDVSRLYAGGRSARMELGLALVPNGLDHGSA